MSGPHFISPGAAAGDAIQRLLLQRAMQQRQQMLDALNIQNTQADNARADEQMRQQRAEFDLTQQRLAAEDAAKADESARKRSTDQNAAGVRQMIADKLQMGPVSPEDAQAIEGMAYANGLPVPGVIAQAVQPKYSTVTVPGPNGQPMHKAVTEAELKAGVPGYVAPKEKNDTQEPLTAIMGPDGQPVLVPRSQAIGKRPASTREQGRPVLSSDANKIASFDTALSQLDNLKTEIGGKDGIGKTGTVAKLEASFVPDAVTQYTGIGEAAKQRQAVINRVKQVIGKTLEGGVLRKEDEVKYEKILPTLGDPPNVAASKLEGLRQAIQNQRQIEIDNLSKANYDTSKFEQAAPAATDAPPPGNRVYYDVNGKPVHR